MESWEWEFNLRPIKQLSIAIRLKPISQPSRHLIFSLQGLTAREPQETKRQTNWGFMRSLRQSILIIKMISVESHSKQIKLLNEYIIALEKQTAAARKENEEQRKGSSQQAEDIRVMNEDINKLRNENSQLKNQSSQLKYTLSRQEEAIRRLMPFEKELQNTREHLQNCIADNNKLKEQLQQAQETNTVYEGKVKSFQADLKKKIELFSQDSGRMRQDNEDLRRSMAEKEREKENLTKLLSSQQKSSANKLVTIESSNNDLIRAKNDAIAKLNKDLEELKLRYNKDMISNSQTRNSLGEQIKQLINTSNESKSDAIAAKKELSQTKQILEKKTAEADDFGNKLKTKSSEYDGLLKKTNQEKITLLKSMQRLEDEKNKLESINASAKGDINENSRALNVAYRRIDQLSAKNIQAAQQIVQKNDSLATSQAQINKLKAVLGETKKELQLKSEESKLREEYIGILKAEVEKSGKEIEDLEALKLNNSNKIAELQQKIVKLKAEVGDRDMQLADKNKTISQRNITVSLKTSEIQNLQAIQKEKQFTISELSFDVQTKSEAIACLSSAKQQLENAVESYKKTKEELEDQISRLNNELSLTRNQKKALQNEKTDLEGRNSQIMKQKVGDKDVLTKEISSRDKRVQELTSKYEKLETLYNLQAKNNAQAIKKLEAEKSSLLIAGQEDATQIESLKKKAEQLQANLTKTKEALDQTMQEYSSYRKKKQAENEELANQLKESEKKNEKRAAKIEQLNQQIIVLENSHSSERKNLGDSQKEEIQRCKVKFNKIIAQLKNQHSELTAKKNTQIDQSKQLLQKTIQEYDQKLKTAKQEYLAKEKALNETIKRLQSEKQGLEKDISRLNLTSITETQSRSTKQLEVEGLKRSLERMEAYSKEQKNVIEQLNRLIQGKAKEVESLESSNAMLRRQVISALNNEEGSRKELLETRSKVNTLMHSGSRNSIHELASSKMEMPSARSSLIYKKKKTSFTSKEENEPKPQAKAASKLKSHGDVMKSSLVEDLSESNFNEDINILPSNIY